MSKLETLNDLKSYTISEDKPGKPARMCLCGEPDYYKYKDLRQLAINSIKHIEKDIKKIEYLESKPQSPLQKIATMGLVEIFRGQITLIKTLFNITEKDLEVKKQ